MSAAQMTMDSRLIHPVIVPAPEVDHGAEYVEGDPVYWDGRSWEVLDWNFECNVFVLLNEADWEYFVANHSPAGGNDVRAMILDALNEAK
jgi:hypothetical protein